MEIDYTKDELISEFALRTLEDRYLIEGESPQDAFMRAATSFGGSEELQQRIYEAASKQWFCFSTPILANAGRNVKGLPISCFLNYVEDSLEGLNEHTVETRMLSIAGGGVGGNWSSVRGQTSKSPGVVPFLKTQDADVLAYHQGTTRRGAYAAYLNVSHPDIMEFINVRKPTGGDSNRKALNIHHGVVIDNKFLEAVRLGSDWDLISPETGEVDSTVPALDIYKLLLTTRHATGEPYLMNADTVREGQPDVHKDLGLKVRGSNLCAEIVLPTDKERTAVCCLSSVNLEKYDEWKDTTLVADLVEYLDNVLTSFIETANPTHYSKAIYSASQERSIGLGAMGFHSYLQSKSITFSSVLGIGLNKQIFKHINDEATKASTELGKRKGIAPDYIKSGSKVGRRNTHLIAIAPNASSSIITATSPSVEPWKANAFLQKTASGSFLVKNRHLETRINKLYTEEERPDIWKSILGAGGSVSNVDRLSEYEKEVFHTAIELDQHWLVQHASDRQEYVCQAQSINLFFPADVTWEYLHSVHWKALHKLKTLYYLRTESSQRAENVSEQITRMEIPTDDNECLACEG